MPPRRNTTTKRHGQRQQHAEGAAISSEVWNEDSGKVLFSLRHTAVTDICFSPDGKIVATASGCNNAKLWDVASGEEMCSLGGHVQGNPSCTCTHGERMETKPDPECPIPGHKGAVSVVAFSPDGKTVATGSQDFTAILWGSASGEETSSLKADARVAGLLFSPDGIVAATIQDRTVKLLDVVSGEIMSSVQDPTSTVFGVALSPNGKILATKNFLMMVRLWDVASGTEMSSWHFKDPLAIRFSPDGNIVAIGCGDKTAKLCDVASGAELCSLKGHKNWVFGVAFSPDGRIVATASSDKTAKLWDVASGTELYSLKHKADMLHVAFSPDGKILATAGLGKTAKLWDVSSARLPSDAVPSCTDSPPPAAEQQPREIAEASSAQVVAAAWTVNSLWCECETLMSECPFDWLVWLARRKLVQAKEQPSEGGPGAAEGGRLPPLLLHHDASVGRTLWLSS